MTRETKIGLLVGLAFIIVIGILLSDHLTSSNEPPGAILAHSGKSVRDTIVTPGGSQPPINPVVVAPTIAPNNPVMTQGDLDAQRKAQEIIRVTGPAGASSNTPTAADPAASPITTFINQPQAPSQPPAQTQQPQAQPQVAESSIPPGVDPNLARIAAQHNQSLIAVSPSGSPIVRPDASPAGAVEYTAQPGDNLSRMANKLLGSNSKANRDAIVRANPSLQANPDKVIVGKSYRIPNAGSVAAAQPPTMAPAAPVVAAQQQTAAGEFWYTVKENDTLTRIAQEQLGLGASAIPSLIELNRDTIKDPNNLQINARIRLPGRPVAQIN